MNDYSLLWIADQMSCILFHWLLLRTSCLWLQRNIISVLIFSEKNLFFLFHCKIFLLISRSGQSNNKVAAALLIGTILRKLFPRETLYYWISHANTGRELINRMSTEKAITLMAYFTSSLNNTVFTRVIYAYKSYINYEGKTLSEKQKVSEKHKVT